VNYRESEMASKTITLRSDLVERLEMLAQMQGRTVENWQRAQNTAVDERD